MPRTGVSSPALDKIAVILHSPSIPENIGSVARVMGNTGFSRLIVSASRTKDWKTAGKLAVSARPLLDNAQVCSSLEEALSLSGANFIVGTSGRDRKYWKARDISEAAQEILGRTSRGKVALLFGPEDAGLTNEELTLCHMVVNIPFGGEMASYNLSHAAAIVLFSIMTASLPDADPPEDETPGFDEMEGMFFHIQELLTEIRFLWDDNPDHMMRAMRGFINRAEPSEAEVKMIRGICRRLLWHLRNRK